MENMSPSNTMDSIQRYSRYLKEGHKVGHALKRLSEMELTTELLVKAHLLEAVRQHEYNKKHGDDAMKLLAKWNDISRVELQISVQKERTPEDKENRKRPSDSSDEIDNKKCKLGRSSPPLKLVIKRSSLSPESQKSPEPLGKSPEPLDQKSLLEKVKSGLAGINRAPSAEKARAPVKKGVLMVKTMRMCGRSQTKKRGINA
ncbi:hypothetical protein PRIPAC_71230 [Pristionchus pacificus]|uniref:Uncharacterized protein n=1 Tax=Pristionchus pacificus TaxID=54126 RepID=A0A454XJX7_PRIPA|nr:hypothetical protein PRIPAC_71230 [Pristionchus pacificus]|eukprot:PDM83761.1 hypothetical protein PRIPAC_30248 [Pristionchus pacificus]